MHPDQHLIRGQKNKPHFESREVLLILIASPQILFIVSDAVSISREVRYIADRAVCGRTGGGRRTAEH